MSTIDETQGLITFRRDAAIRLIDDLECVPKFLQAVQAIGPFDHYKFFPDACYRLVDRVGATNGEIGRRQMLEAALWQAMLDSIESGKLASLPSRIRAHQLRQFNRILTRDSRQLDWVNIHSDFFQKEFGLAALRLYAGAAQLIDPNCGVPRSVFLKSGLGGAVRGAMLALECGGLKPMLQIHTHTAYLDEFNDLGWRECYRVCVDLYEFLPHILGVFGGSWFYDPVIAEISPRLAYLAAVPREGGAHFFLAATEGDFAVDATATSPSRRKLMEEGSYRPHSFLMIWGRAAQRRWAQRPESRVT